MVLGIRVSILACRIRRRDYRAKKFKLRTDMLVDRYYRLRFKQKDLRRKSNDE